MRCRNCGNEITNDSKYCTACGYFDDGLEEELSDGYFESVEEIDEEDLKDKNIPEEEIEEEIDNNLIKTDNSSFYKKEKENYKSSGFQNDRLMEAFVGEDYKWVIRRPINIYALLLSWIYFLYRKMYIMGIIGLTITGVIIRIYPNLLIYYVPIVMILSGLLFNPIYRLVAKIRIIFIKKKSDNQDDYSLEQLCQKYGGVTVIKPLIIFLIFILIMIRTYYVFYINNENRKFWEENSQNKANCQSISSSYYKYIKEENIEGDLVDIVCSINKNGTKKEYNIYIKLQNNTNTKYLCVRNDNSSLIIEGAKGNLEQLQQKTLNRTITQEENAIYAKLNDIKNNYTKYYNESKEEDKLIKTRKNKSEKLNYIFEKDEIIR